MNDAPRITPIIIEQTIQHEHYFTAYEGVLGERFHHEGAGDNDANEPDIPDALRLMTICVLTLENGFTVVGTGACASPENYNAEIGRKIAREKAVEQMWPLLGYELRSRLHAVYLGEGDKVTGISLSTIPASAPAQGAAGDRQVEGHEADPKLLNTLDGDTSPGNTSDPFSETEAK